MNNFHSSFELKYKKRLLADLLREGVKSFPVIILTGARQVGKSTLLLHEFSDFKYYNLDDINVLKQAKADPASLWIDSQKVIIDEAQKVPELFQAIKLEIDRSNLSKRFILSGSSHLLLMEKITESLAGRAIYFELMPMTLGEIKENLQGLKNFLSLWNETLKLEEVKEKGPDPVSLIFKGFMPPLLRLDSKREILLWWESYVKTYLERDLRELSQVESLIDFRRVLEVLAPRTATIINQTEIARETGLSQPTVHRYLKLLEISALLKRVPYFARSRIKRVIKSPKLFFLDPALSVYLSGYHDEESLRSAKELGRYFETMVFLHLSVYCEVMVPKGKIFYFRTTTGKEVDFIIEHGRKLLAIEVKLTQKLNYEDIKNLLYFLEEHPETIRGVVLYGGDEVKWLHRKVLALPWWWLL